MNTKNLEAVISSTEKVLEDVLSKEGRITVKAAATRVATETGLPVSAVKEAVVTYVKNRPDLMIRAGRGGGIMRATLRPLNNEDVSPDVVDEVSDVKVA